MVQGYNTVIWGRGGGNISSLPKGPFAEGNKNVLWAVFSKAAVSTELNNYIKRNVNKNEGTIQHCHDVSNPPPLQRKIFI